ncbi:MAG TPA: XRE family transcriptional regulator [Bacteroidales bacterium]|nr:XRE family transcriptional regulator [Bacteroidales bacterium]
MDSFLSQKQIGQRIAKLRKSKGFSQAELAKSLGISRSSLAQVELGNRNVGLQEIQRMSVTLTFSVDDFLSESFGHYLMPGETITDQVQEPAIRVSIPSFNAAKFKNVILYILEWCGGKPNVGETVLYKLLYFSDFNYYEIYEEHLSGAKYRKLPFGPVPQNSDLIINQMVKKGELQKIKTTFHGYVQIRLLPLVKADLTLFRGSEIEVIDKVINQMSEWSASTISDYSHKDMPWMATHEGEEINYELVFYREPPFSVRPYAEESEAS